MGRPKKNINPEPTEIRIIPPEEIIELSKKQLKLNNELDLAGVTEKRLHETLRKGLNAKKTTTELMDGRMVVSETDDLVLQHKYMETGYKLRGLMNDEKIGLNVLNMDASLSSMILKETRKVIEATTSQAQTQAQEQGTVACLSGAGDS